MHLTRLFVLLLVLWSLPFAAAAGDSKTLEHNGREYILYTPPNLTGAAPLLMVLHGGGGSASWMERQLEWGPVADRYGFRVAYLNGTGGKGLIGRNLRTWNGGLCCANAVKENINDVGYLTGFIGMITRQGIADPKRIYMMGHSNGAIMIYRFACEHRELVAGVVVVSGTIGVNQCRAPGLPMLHIHGQEDTNVPIKGGKGKTSITGDLYFPSVQFSDDFMRRAGATVQTILVPETPHKLSTISENMKSQTGKSLEETAAAYLQDKRAP